MENLNKFFLSFLIPYEYFKIDSNEKINNIALLSKESFIVIKENIKIIYLSTIINNNINLNVKDLRNNNRFYNFNFISTLFELNICFSIINKEIIAFEKKYSNGLLESISNINICFENVYDPLNNKKYQKFIISFLTDKLLDQNKLE